MEGRCVRLLLLLSISAIKLLLAILAAALTCFCGYLYAEWQENKYKETSEEE